MTDLPRKAFPLVVAPPGGFEDAVRRGRRRRRQQTGGSTGAALALVGVLAYAVSGNNGGGTDRLDLATQPEAPHSAPAVGPIGGEAVTSTSPGVTPTATAPATGTRPLAGKTPDPGVAASAVPTVRPSVPSTRPPQSTPTLTYAARPKIVEDPEAANTEIDCVVAPGAEWCTAASVDTTTDEIYRLYFAVCRGAAAGEGKLTFDRDPEVDFTVVQDDTNDPVWTYSAGQPVVRQSRTLEIAAGNCVVWHTDWDGLDDFGRMPAQARYTLTARSFALEGLPPSSFGFDHQ